MNKWQVDNQDKMRNDRRWGGDCPLPVLIGVNIATVVESKLEAEALEAEAVEEAVSLGETQVPILTTNLKLVSDGGMSRSGVEIDVGQLDLRPLRLQLRRWWMRQAQRKVQNPRIPEWPVAVETAVDEKTRMRSW